MTQPLHGQPQRARSEKTHEQDGPRPVRSDHSNLGPQERTPHPTVRRHAAPRRAAARAPRSGHAGAR